MNPNNITYSNHTSTENSSSLHHSLATSSNPVHSQLSFKEEPSASHSFMDPLDPNLVADLGALTVPSTSISSPHFVDDTDSHFLWPLSQNFQTTNNDVSSIQNTPFQNVQNFSENSISDVVVRCSPVTNRLDPETLYDDNEVFPQYILPANASGTDEISLATSSSTKSQSFKPKSLPVKVTNQRNTSSPVRQARTPRSRRSTPKPSTLSSAITRQRNPSLTRSAPSQVHDDTVLIGSPSVKTSTIHMVTPSSVPTPRRSDGPFALDNNFSLGIAWKPSKQLVEAHVQAKHATITAEIESWKQKTREDLRRQDANKSDPPAKLASKREAFISRKKNEKKNELLEQQLAIAIEENLIIKHKLELLTDAFKKHNLGNQL